MRYVSRLTLLVALALFVTAVNAAQQDAAAQRAAIANQRIQAEAETRRRAEEAAIKAQEQAAQQPVQQATSTPTQKTQLASASQPVEPHKSRADMSRTLQQIRTLGELRDAGYVTDDEFQRIKERILEGAL